MNKVALNKVIPHLTVLTVHPVKIAVDVDQDKQFLASTGQAENLTFSRLQWTCPERAVRTLQPVGDQTGAPAIYLLSFLIETRVDIAEQPAAGPIPESEQIPADLMLSTIKVTFSVDYQCDIDPEHLDQDGLMEFLKHNVPYHFWPYWREASQSLALRALTPPPNFPSYRVPTEAQSSTAQAK